MTNFPAGSATGIDLAALEQLARAAYLADERCVAFLSPGAALDLIALARATSQHSVTEHALPSIDNDPEFQQLAEAWKAEPYGTRSFLTAWDALVAHVDSRAQPLASTAATQPEQASDDGPDLSNIEIPAGDRNGNAYEQLCAAWHRNPCGDTLAPIGSAILALRPMYEPPLHDDILIMQKANEFLSRSEEVGEWAGDIDGIIGFAQFFKAYGAALAIPASTAPEQADIEMVKGALDLCEPEEQQAFQRILAIVNGGNRG